MNRKQIHIPKVQPAKFVEKGNGVIKGYAVNTFHGMVKQYNEDRVSIIMNITKPNYKGKWPKCSYFGVFDGHGGDLCSNFLKDNMHKYITENQHFPNDPIQALKEGFKKAQSQFVSFAMSLSPPDRSGSCALVVLIIDQICYIANVGDSRAILSTERGSKVYSLSNDHKPDSSSQKSRIQKANGKIYQTIIKTKNGGTILGPWRINPGKLSVSRSFGDIQAKMEKYGGNPRVLIAKPEITYFEISDVHDFIVMGSDGIFDKLNNEQISDCFWERHSMKKANYDYIGEASSKILTESMNHMSMDNLTSLIIVFDDHGRLNIPTNKNIQIKEQTAYSSFNNDKENSQKDDPNIMKQEKDITYKMMEKLTMGRKNNHLQETQENPTKQLVKANSFKMLKKDSTMKVLPSHRKQQLGNDRFSGSLSKSGKPNSIDKIR